MHKNIHKNKRYRNHRREKANKVYWKRELYSW